MDLGFFKGSGRYLGVAELMVDACGLSVLLLAGVVKMKHLSRVFAFTSATINIHNLVQFVLFLASPKNGWKPSDPPKKYPVQYN